MWFLLWSSVDVLFIVENLKDFWLLVHIYASTKESKTSL